MIEDIDYHVVNFLKKIVDAKGEPIPILFRPLHEIDGGWFWWTCTSNPQNTAKLYKILQDRIINFHQVHNLIWIWNNGVGVSNGSWPPYQQIDNAKRAAYYPGDAYCDIVGIDLYGFDPVNRGSYANTGKTYRDAWNMLKAAITKNKMLALCEAEALPDAQKCFTDPNYAPWLYCLPWYAENYYDDISKTVNICTWNNAQFNSSYVINKGVYLSQTITAVDDPLSEKRAVVLYPNPLTHGKARIELQGFSSYNKITVVVHDYTGRLRYTTLKTTGNAIEIPYTAFSKGLNLIKLRSGDFEKTLKLMVQ
jgi:mannan endo-1,4-beta-mannosidase